MPNNSATLTAARLSAWSDALARMMAAPDDDAVPGKLCAAIGEVVPIDYAAIFVLRRHAPPITILDNIPSGLEPVPYEEGPYLLDPIYIRFLDGTLPTCGLLDELCPDDFFQCDYYLRYWNSIDLASEFSFNVPCNDDTAIHIAVHRVSDSPPFSMHDVELMTAISSVVVATMVRYWRSRKGGFARSGPQADLFHQRLTSVLYNFGTSLLTAREMEVTRLAMRGFSDKLTARMLEITPGTVRNHKKSVFRKLRVTSQGQVFGLFLDALQLPANEDTSPDPLVTVLQQRE